MPAPAPTRVSAAASVGPDRLASSRDVRHVLRHGDRASGRQLTVHVCTGVDHGVPRMAVIASRRVGPAVARNRAKRLLREAGRRVNWPADADVVLVARPGIVGADLWRVLDELRELSSTSRGGDA